MAESSLNLIEDYCNAFAASTGRRCRNRTKGCPSGFCSFHRASGDSSTQNPKAKQHKDCTGASLASTSQEKRSLGLDKSAFSPHKRVNTGPKAEAVKSTKADVTKPLAIPSTARNIVEKKPSVNATLMSMIEQSKSLRIEDLHVPPVSASAPSVLQVKQDVQEKIGSEMKEGRSSEADCAWELAGSASRETLSLRIVTDMPEKAVAGNALQEVMKFGEESAQSAETGALEKSMSPAEQEVVADCKRGRGAMKGEMSGENICVEWLLPVGAPVFYGCPRASLRDPFFEDCASVEGRRLKQKYQCAEGCEQCKSGWKHILPSYWRPSSCSNVDSYGAGKDKMKSDMQHLEAQPSKRRKDWHSFLPSFFSRRLSSISHSSTEVIPSQSTYEDELAETNTTKQDLETRPSKKRKLFGNWFSQ